MLRMLIVKILRVVLVIMLVIGVIVFFIQEGMIYLPPAPYKQAELDGFERRGIKQIEFETEQGKQVAFYKPPTAGDKVPEQIWMVFGGNGGLAAYYEDVAGVAEWGYLFIDYPGYGLSEGKPNPKRIDAAVDGTISALGEMLDMGDEELEEKLSVLGHSLGGAVGLRAAERHQIDRVVLVAPFTTMKKMAAGTVGGLYANLLRHRFDNIAALEAIEEQNPDARVSIMSGADDRVIPWTMGQELAERFETIATFRKVEGSGHNDIIGNELEQIVGAMKEVGEAR